MPILYRQVSLGSIYVWEWGNNHYMVDNITTKDISSLGGSSSKACNVRLVSIYTVRLLKLPLRR